MKKIILSMAVVLLSTMSYAQFQVSVSGGYAMSSAGMVLGTEVNSSGVENSYGSYGQGGNVQIRGTYFFNDTFGADLSLGYLNGADQTISKIDLPSQGIDVEAIARARAFGASLSLVYKFTNNVYGRFGALLKVGGKTEAIVNSTTPLSEDQLAGSGLPVGSYTTTNYTEDFHGVFPLGFVAALGYKYDLNSNFSLFAELEYYGISLKRKDSELQSFNTDLYLPDGTLAIAGYKSMDNLPDGRPIKITYYDELTYEEAADPSKELTQKVPYSSFGLNVGVTYKFKSATKTQ
ncbi:outer membrane beta-barrel protein [Formosa sp. PL04]|uniref:outer membrane beta-barrel protein n=1 Tax=Formosa sp. PL04 TaxID=3081755 RepID=UPI0029827EDD|nr:outer membrane beta-barrel protein [Formosa sp. PL04]MDW5290386.1 outer membrane beta-barrel protein [Formosa sp. PL04]